MKKLSYQLIIIYSIVISMLTLVFTIFLNAKLNSMYKTENYSRIEQVLNGLTLNQTESYIPKDISTYVKNLTLGTMQKKESNEYKIDDTFINQLFNEISSEFPKRIERKYGDNTYYFSGVKIGQTKYLSCSNTTYISKRLNENLIQIILIFFIILILGNMVLILWSRWIVKRIIYIKNNINNQDVTSKINDMKFFDDEISDLTVTIFNMRNEIYHTERIKQEMLQNISHDFKTPIAVIKSYAEAIRDQIVSISDTNIILKQTDLLNRKVLQLLEITKLDYLDTIDIETTEINITDIIENLLQNYKIINSNINVELENKVLYFNGNYEHFYTVFDNILDNAYRYAKEKITITIDDNSITIYNDGEPISDSFLEKIFLPYEKSNQGKFGLGMAIVKRIINLYNLNINIKNLENGVEFKIYKES